MNCSVPGCTGGGRLKRGMCRLHYSRWLRNGTLTTLIEMHGMTQTAIYRRWSSMRQRCYYKGHRHYDRYGGRGITICNEWRESFLAFYRDMGDPLTPNHQIDRIDNNLGYSKENCRWVLPAINSRNRSSTKLSVEAIHEIRRLKAAGATNQELAMRFGIKAHSIANLNWHWKESVA